MTVYTTEPGSESETALRLLGSMSEAEPAPDAAAPEDETTGTGRRRVPS